jgi:hypothetical protein
MNYRGAFNTQTSNRWNVFFCSVIILYHSRLNFIIYALCKVKSFQPALMQQVTCRIYTREFNFVCNINQGLTCSHTLSLPLLPPSPHHQQSSPPPPTTANRLPPPSTAANTNNDNRMAARVPRHAWVWMSTAVDVC